MTTQLTPTQKRQVEQALDAITSALDPSSPVTNRVLAGVEELRKALDMDSDNWWTDTDDGRTMVAEMAARRRMGLPADW